VNRRDFVIGAGSLAFAPRAFAASLRTAPVALVTADLEARLVVVDLPHGRVRGYVRTPSFPRSIETVGDHAVVAHSEIGVVSIVHAPTLTVVHVLHGFVEPRYTAGHPDGRHAYVTDAGRGEVVALDVVRGRVLGREQVGSRARHVTINPGRRSLWIALGSSAKELAIVDVSAPARPRLVRRFRPDLLAHDVGVAPDGRHVWVTSGDRNELLVYDASSGRLLARPSADWPPQHVTFAGGRAYVTSGWSGTLRVHRIDGTSLGTAVVPVGSYNVQQASGWVLTPSLGRGNLSIVDERGRVLTRRKIAKSSHDVCVVEARR
jgi:DNA-binding beta-propeller fold protein YncE